MCRPPRRLRLTLKRRILSRSMGSSTCQHHRGGQSVPQCGCCWRQGPQQGSKPVLGRKHPSTQLDSCAHLGSARIKLSMMQQRVSACGLGLSILLAQLARHARCAAAPSMLDGRVVEAHSKPVGSTRTAPAPVDRRAWANAMAAARLARTSRQEALLLQPCNNHPSFLHVQTAQPDIPFLPDSASCTVRKKALEAIRKSSPTFQRRSLVDLPKALAPRIRRCYKMRRAICLRSHAPLHHPLHLLSSPPSLTVRRTASTMRTFAVGICVLLALASAAAHGIIAEDGW